MKDMFGFSNWSQTHDDRLMVNLLLILNAANLRHLYFLLSQRINVYL